MKYGIDAPCNLITNREDVPLRMEMLSLADFSEVDNRHDADVQGQQRFTLLVTGYNRDTVALGEDCMRLQPLRLGESLVFGARAGATALEAALLLFIIGGTSPKADWLTQTQ
jgi:hypothetical protein